MLHYKACARTRKEKVGDIAVMVFGALAAVYTTVQTIKVGFRHRRMYPPIAHHNSNYS